MTKREFFENELKMKPSEIGTAVPFNPNGETEVTEEWLISFIKNLLAERKKWHTGTPAEEGYYLVHISLDDDEYDLCMYFKDGVWDERKWGFNALKVEVIAWQKITPFEANKEN